MATLNIAHRGGSALGPENTFAAFEKALAAGADGFEFDLHLSRDGHPVIIHDETLERTTNGSGPVGEAVLEELQKLDAGSWFGSEFTGARIPALAELFERYKDKNLLFNAELKTDIVPYPHLAEAVLKLVSRFGLEERVIISSFNWETLKASRTINPKVRTGLLYALEVENPWDMARELGCYSVHPLFFYLQNPETLARFRRESIPLYPWTVNDPEMMETFLNAGLEAIITDYPGELAQLIRARSGR